MKTNTKPQTQTWDPSAARLIAAAPDILDIVRRLAMTYESEQSQLANEGLIDGKTIITIPHALGQAARAAIAKAESK